MVPDAVEYVPPGHARHEVLVRAPLDLEYEPAGHATHALASDVGSVGVGGGVVQTTPAPKSCSS